MNEKSFYTLFSSSIFQNDRRPTMVAVIFSNRRLALVFALCFVTFWLASLFGVYKISSPERKTAAQVALQEHMGRLTKALNTAEQSRQRIDALHTQFEEALAQLEGLDEGEDRDRLLAEIEERIAGSMAAAGGAGYHLSGASLPGSKSSPSSDYEQLRRRIETNVKEFWRYANTEAKKLDNAAPVLNLLGEHKSSLLNDLDEMRKSDGYDDWRRAELESLSELVQKRLHYIQHPDDCSTARKLVCRLNKGCGYGCQIHHVAYCFIMAYATERTLILKSESWRYNRAGWEQVFQPLSDTCKSAEGTSLANWPATDNIQVVTCPIADSLNPRPAFLPLAIPADLAPRLMRVHGDPAVWWIGQFIKYLLRFQPATQGMLDRGMEKLNFRGPIVGVHIRRTDKVGTEAAFHSVDEYMVGVKEYYDQMAMKQNGADKDKRRVFIASDDPQVIAEARKKYPDYEIIGDPNVAKSAAVSTRYDSSSLNGIILDTYLLSKCDYLVCTFSSQVCRLAYEMKMGQPVDTSDQFISLDDIYYYGGQSAHNREAVVAHKPRNAGEIYLRPGDLVGIAGNHWNGLSKGHNENTNQGGLFPSFKVKDKVRVTDFPTYSHVK